MKEKKKFMLFAAYRHAGIKIQLLTIAGLLTALLCIVIFVFYSRMEHSLRQNSYEEVTSYVDEVNRSIAIKCNTYNRFVGFIAFNEIIQNFVTTDQSDISNWIEQTNRVNNFFQNTRIFHDDIIDIIVMNREGQTYGLTQNFREADARIQETLHMKESYVYSEVIDCSTKSYQRKGVIVSTRIYSINPHQSLYDIGAVALVIQPEGIGLSETAEARSTPTQLFLLDRCGKVFSRSNQTVDDEVVEQLAQSSEQNFRKKIDGTWYMVYLRNIDVFGGKLVGLVSEKEVLAQASSARNLALLLLISSFLLLFFPVFWVVRGVINPIRSLSQYMAQIGNMEAEERNLSELDHPLELDGCREAREMADEFNRMMNTIKELTQTVIRKDKRLLSTELEKKQAELSFLQSQINPHFLCNTFDSIKGMAALHHEPEIRSMANDLSIFFRYSIRPGERVPLKDELDAVDRYIRIQKVRFGDRFTVRYQIAENTRNITVLKMILQPLVENAIIHGVGCMESNGLLIIQSELTGDTLTLRVRDNGSGIEPEKLERMRKKLAGISLSREADIVGYRAGIGVVNVNNRIRLTYGNEYGISIVSRVGEGTIVTLRIKAEPFTGMQE